MLVAVLGSIFLSANVSVSDPFLRRNEVPVSGIPTIRVEVPYYADTPEDEERLSIREVTELGLFEDKDLALKKCESSYEGLVERIEARFENSIVMKVEKCRLTGPFSSLRPESLLPYTHYRYEAYVSFLQPQLLIQKSELPAN